MVWGNLSGKIAAFMKVSGFTKCMKGRGLFAGVMGGLTRESGNTT